MNILLTGASGFLGSALALHFRGQGHRVGLLARPTSDFKRLRGREAEFDIERCTTDAHLDAFVQRIHPEVVIHTACSYGRLGETTVQLLDANVRLGVSLLQSLLRLQHPQQSVQFINTGTALAPDVSPYALSKHQLSDWGRLLAASSGGTLRFVNVRLQHMYGPGDDASKFTTHVLQACRRNDAVLKLTLGEQTRDFIYIDDVVSAYATLVAQADRLPPVLDIDVGSGMAPSIREFVQIAHRVTASRTELQFGALPYRANEAMHCLAHIEPMRALGWQPEHDLTAGLTKTLALDTE